MIRQDYHWCLQGLPASLQPERVITSCRLQRAREARSAPGPPGPDPSGHPPDLPYIPHPLDPGPLLVSTPSLVTIFPKCFQTGPGLLSEGPEELSHRELTVNPPKLTAFRDQACKESVSSCLLSSWLRADPCQGPRTLCLLVPPL